jgi:exopolyphosphatase/pppGpp-phosphohydrolase
MIGIGQDLRPICLLLHPASSSIYTSAHKAHCTKILRRANWSGFTGANTLWLAQNVVYAGLLNSNNTEVAAAYNVSNKEIYSTNFRVRIQTPIHPSSLVSHNHEFL